MSEKPTEERSSSKKKIKTIEFEEYVIGDSEVPIRIPKSDSLKQALNEAFSIILDKIDTLKRKIDTLQNNVSSLAQQLQDVQSKIKGSNKITDLDKRLRNLEESFSRIHNELQTLREISQKRRLILRRIIEQLKQFKIKTKEIDALTLSINELREKFNEIAQKLREIRQELFAIKSPSASLYQRLEEIERRLDEVYARSIRQSADIKSLKTRIELDENALQQVLKQFEELADRLRALRKKQLLVKELPREESTPKIREEIPLSEKIKQIEKKLKKVTDTTSNSEER